MPVRVVVVTPPDPVVTLEQAKRQLRVEHDDDDAYIADLVEVATAWLDGPAGWLGRSLGLQTLDAVLPASCADADARLPFPPLVAIVGRTASQDGRTVTVRYRAGYGFSGEGEARKSLVPAPIRHAILLMVAHLYANREAVTAGTAKPEQMPLGVDALLVPFRVWGL